MKAAARTGDGVFVIDLEAEELLEVDADVVVVTPLPPLLELPRVVAAASSGSTVVAIVDRRPPLLISHDAGRTWHESGGGLPVGVALAIDNEYPDRILYGARNRLYLSQDGGRFWHALAPELPTIEAVAFLP